MTDLCTASAVIAQTNMFEQMGRRFRPGGNSFDLMDALVWLLFIAGAVSLAWFLHKVVSQIAHAKRSSLNGLFGQLCTSHGISWQGRKLLYQLAGVYGLAHPAQLFMRPDCFRPQTLPPEMAAYQNDVARLKAMLFGDRDGDTL